MEKEESKSFKAAVDGAEQLLRDCAIKEHKITSYVLVATDYSDGNDHHATILWGDINEVRASVMELLVEVAKHENPEDPAERFEELCDQTKRVGALALAMNRAEGENSDPEKLKQAITNYLGNMVGAAVDKAVAGHKQRMDEMCSDASDALQSVLSNLKNQKDTSNNDQEEKGGD